MKYSFFHIKAIHLPSQSVYAIHFHSSVKQANVLINNG